MALSTKIDHFGLASANLVLAGSSSKTPAYAVQATAQDGCGNVVGRTHTGDQGTVESNYRLKGEATIAASLGAVTTKDDSIAVLTGLTINTAAGSPPTVQATGEILPIGATEVTEISLGSITVTARHCAQMMMSAVTATEDAKVIECTLTASCSFTRTLVDGVTVSHDLSAGLLTVTATATSVLGSGTLAAGTGWTATALPSKTEDEDGYFTITIEVVKDLTSAAAE